MGHSYHYRNSKMYVPFLNTSLISAHYPLFHFSAPFYINSMEELLILSVSTSLLNLPIPAKWESAISSTALAFSMPILSLHLTRPLSTLFQLRILSFMNLCIWSLNHFPSVLLLPQQPFLPSFLCKRNCMNQDSAQQPRLFSKYTSVLSDLILATFILLTYIFLLNSKLVSWTASQWPPHGYQNSTPI